MLPRKVVALVAAGCLLGAGLAGSGASAAARPVTGSAVATDGSVALAPATAARPVDAPAASSTALSPSHTPTPSRTPTPAPTATTAGGSPGPSATPEQLIGPVTNLAPLPKCTLGDAMTPLTSYDDWTRTLVDTNLEVGSGYAPPDLTDVKQAGFYSGNQVRAVAIPDLRAMGSAAKSAGVSLAIFSAYRDYHTQIWTFGHWVNTLGQDKALLSSARPGHSEHQLGLAIDFKESGGPDPWAYYNWGKDTKAGQWLAANAWRFGFVLSYPYGKTAVTCYGFEPWHYRYVGRLEAASIYNSGLTTREWMWEHQPDQSGPNATPVPYPTIAAVQAVPSLPVMPVLMDAPNLYSRRYR